MSPKAAISVVNGVVGAILSTAALIFIAQNMGASTLGILGYALATVGLLSFLSDFGVGSVHVNHIRAGGDVGKCVGAYASIRLVLIAIFSVVTFILIETWKRTNMGGEMPHTFMVVDSLQVFLVYYILLGISQIATHTFEGLGSVAKVHVPSLLELVVRVSFIIYVATSSLKSSSEGAALLAAAYAAGIIASSILVALLFSRIKISRPDRATIMEYIRSLTPVFAISAIIVVDLFLDKMVVGFFWGDFELGLYFGVQKMAIFVGVFSLSVATLILPSVTTYFIKRDVAASWDVVNQAERYVSLIVIPTAAFYLTFGTQILDEFLTHEFTAAVRTMDVLVLSAVVLALVLPLRSAIAGTGKHSTLFYVGIGGVTIQLIALLLLVPEDLFGVRTFGLKGQGAAVALLISSVYYFFVLRYMAWSTAKIVPNSRSYRHILNTIVMVGLLYAIDWLFIPSVDWLALILLAILAAIIYGTVSYVTGELEASDYRYFRSLLNPQDTFQYVAHEILGKRSP
jgi:putative peptidoglycan lipid II flippase